MTSIRPRSSPLVERLEDVGARHRRRSAARACEPFLDGGPRREPGGFAAEQLRDREPGLSSTANEAGVYVVVEVADLDRLRHPGNVSCKFACCHA